MTRERLPGVLPTGVVEPLNIVQREAISGIAAGVPNLGFQRGAVDAFQQRLSESPSATPFLQGGQQALGRSGELFNQGAQSFLPQVGQVTQQFFNPFEEQVVNQTIADLNRNADLRQRNLRQQATGAGAFGGTGQAVAQAQIERDLGENIGRAAGQLRQQGFDTAQQRALQQLQNQRQAQFTAGQGQAGLGSQQLGAGFRALGQLGDIAQQGINIRGQNIKDFLSERQAQLGAGSVIQQQNQRLLDASRQRLFEDPRSQRIQGLQFLGETLQRFPSSAGVANVQPSTFERGLGGALSGLGLGQSLGSALGGLF